MNKKRGIKIMKRKKLKTIKRKMMSLFLVLSISVSYIMGAGICVKADEEVPAWVHQFGYYKYSDSYDKDTDTLIIGSINLYVVEPEKKQPIRNAASCNEGKGSVTSVEWYLDGKKVDAGTIAGYNKNYTAKIEIAPPSAGEHNIRYADSVSYSIGNGRANSCARNSDGSLTVTASVTTGKGSISNGTSKATVVYDGNPIDIEALGMFSFDKNAGPVESYTIVDMNYDNEPTTGEGYITGSMLTVTKPGRFVIQATTQETEEYVSSHPKATLVVKGPEEVGATSTPSPTELPEQTAAPTNTPVPTKTTVPTETPVPTKTTVPTETPQMTAVPTEAPQYSSTPYEPALSGQISVDDNKWEIFCRDFNFKILLKDKAKVSIVPTNIVSDVAQIKYYISDKVLSRNDLIKLNKDLWKIYEEEFYIEDTGKNVVYAKLSDSMGNSNYISSNGITLYKDTVQKSDSATYVKSSGEDCKVELELNGNIVKKLKNGNDELTNGTDYAMSEDGTVILKSRYLENLEIGEHEFRVSYRLGDYEYEHDDEKLLSDTSFKVKVENAAIDNGNDNNSDDGNDNNNGKTDGNSGNDDDNQILQFDVQKNKIKLNAGFKVSQVKDMLVVSWGKLKSSTGYVVYVQECDKKYTKKSQNIVKSGKAGKIKIKKVNGKKLNLKKNYKIYVSAYTIVNGQKYNIGKTITAHVVGRKNAKWTNVKKVKIPKKFYALKVGKTIGIKAETVLVDKKKKPLSNKHARRLRYASDDKKIATVSKTGKIKAKKKGKCKIYVYARNGYAKKINITVK